MQNFSFLACLEVAEKFVVVVQTSFRVQLNNTTRNGNVMLLVVHESDQIMQIYVHLWASYTKSWQLMAKFVKLMQSFSQIWACYAKLQLVIHNFGKIMQINVHLWSSFTIL